MWGHLEDKDWFVELKTLFEEEGEREDDGA